MAEPERPPLRAVPAPAGELPPAEGPPVYADITGEAERRPVLPQWLRRGNFRPAVARWRGWLWHEARFHGLRLPWYLACTVFWSVAGVFWLAWEWLCWWLMPVPAEAHVQAVGDGWRAWKSLHLEHKRTAKVRGLISAAVAVLAVVLGELLWARARLLLASLGLAGMLAAARFGRPEGVRIVTPAYVPGELEKLTPDVISRALRSLGISKIDQWFRDGKQLTFPHPVRQDGPGWRAEVDLPYGVTATMVIERREQLASGLRRPLGAVWPEPVTSEHTGRLELWVGQEDITGRKPVPWPLLRSGTVDVFKPVPAGTDTRGRPVKAPLIYHNWLIGSMPGNGKTGTVAELNAAIALDPLCRQWVHELKGTGDLDPFEPLCERFVSGIDDASIAYAAESLRLLRAECERRGPKIKRLPPAICPEKRLTREIAEKYADLRPLGCTIDECQNLFAHPKYGKQAGADAEFVIKVGRALGIFLILATQRPDKDSLPTGVSGNVSIRFCLYVAGQVENDMILGTSAYKNGVRATLFRPEVDAGLGYLKGATPVPKVVKTYFLTVPQKQAIVARARVLRERAGTLPVPGEAEGERDVLADVLAALGPDPGLHWGVLAERLAGQWPDRWTGATGDSVSAECRELGVPSEDVRYPTTRSGTVRKGCKRDSVVAAASRDTAGQVAPV